MHLEVDTNWLNGIILCSIRLSALLLFSPLLHGLGLPMRLRVLMVLALSVVLVSGMGMHPAQPVIDLGNLIAAGVSELATGALMAFGIFTAFAAFSFAGNALDLQMGFNIANIFDPVTRSQAPLLASLLAMVAVSLFFSMDAHHALLRGLAYSFEKLPLGSAANVPEPNLLIRQSALVFSLGLTLAAPVMFMLFLLELALAVVSRNLPQMNIFLLSTPIKITVGLCLLAAVSSHLAGTARRVFDAIFVFWEGVL